MNSIQIFFKQLLLSFTLMVISACLYAQTGEKMVKINISPDHLDWIYKPGEPVKFNISVNRFNNPIPNVKIDYELGPEKMEASQKKSLQLPSGTLALDGGTLKEPGFLRCAVTAEVDGVKYRNITTVGFEPGNIKPTVELPSDFQQFWAEGKKELAKIPMDAKLTLLPERCTEKTNVYHVNLQGYGKPSRLYGILCMPKKEGKYPALLRVPGAGIRPYNGDIANAEKGMITLEIGIHGIPVNLDPGVYTSLAGGALADYQQFNMDDKDKFYYKRVYLNCIRANDFLVSLPSFDGVNLGVTGGSQGGALSIVTAGLDDRVTCLAAFYPALSDVTGYLKGRAGGWPHYFNQWGAAFNNKKEKIATVAYYDVVNFARQVKAPGFYSWGFNDETCPPTSMYASYNVIKAPKKLVLALDTGHWAYTEQYDASGSWLYEHLKAKK